MNYQGGSNQQVDRLASRRSQISSGREVPIGLKIVGVIARAIFIMTFIAVTWRVSVPEDMTDRALAHYTLVDFVRAAIGIAICVGMTLQLARLPRGQDGYKAWTIVGVLMALAWLMFAVLKLVFPGA
jgi:hypothetical protein